MNVNVYQLVFLVLCFTLVRYSAYRCRHSIALWPSVFAATMEGVDIALVFTAALAAAQWSYVALGHL